jgi:hypothetical protein
MKLWRLLLLPALALLLGALALGLRHDPKQIPRRWSASRCRPSRARHWTGSRSIWPRPDGAGRC